MRILILGSGMSLGRAIGHALLDAAIVTFKPALCACISDLIDWTLVKGVSDTGLTTYQRIDKARYGRQHKVLVGPLPRD